ncbi:membrane protein [Streptococcus equi subsp. zooepidemicus Sz16]|uniref:hypothetical protein n=1 Tax=Streptococcus equi TaxID=1336 RepID=UPI0005B89EED|nr:hypothetical protein [Streptococcus equi]HEK9996068.1 hypothetical protein [Streptococcus equi subsp. zooepidemicus]KIS07097.1 membrane protein [Streptococcus equi subsp. zooepidemicus Sz16]KIS17876.1 membrane protein [Streptococcus equi subsp. zooepidemicus SzAM35]HEL0553383.1 hypothetical protein [Streptococcus equi subsp. zooepidemicus]HEL0805325.1 hypothetical protein [Streptococcus equi subsp. zooepidemicus]
MVMLMRTLLFPVDNGMGTGLTGNGLAAEYDLWTGKVTWRQLGDGKIKRQQKVAAIINLIAAAISPLVIMSIIFTAKSLKLFDVDTSTTIYRYAPLMVGLVFFFSFELLMLAIRRLYPLAKEEPNKEQQHLYFKTMYDITIRKNDIMPQNSIPFLGTYIAFLIAFSVIPIFYFQYLQQNSFWSYLGNLVGSSILISLVPNFLWNVLLKQLIYIKLIRKTKEKILKNET